MNTTNQKTIVRLKISLKGFPNEILVKWCIILIELSLIIAFPRKGPGLKKSSTKRWLRPPAVETLNEKATKEKLIVWVNSQGLNAEHLFIELNIHKLPDSCSFKSKIDEPMVILRAIGLKNIINVFCQIGKKFSADYFRERLTAISVHESLSMMIFPILES